jgi:hypothetical protein
VSLVDAVIDVFFGLEEPPTALSIGLGQNGSELAVEGYTRKLVARGDWLISAGEAQATVTFGPYRAQVRVNEGRIYSGNQLLRTLPFSGDATYPPGQEVIYTAIVRGRELDG